MTNFDEMEQFVNWDKAIDAFQYPQGDNTLVGLAADNENIDLVLGNVSEDDFSFCALQHFSDNNFPLPDMPAPAMDFTTTADDISSQFQWDTPPSPCVNCSMAGFSCKKIREGMYKDYCTTCVALKVDCSFAVAPNATNANSSVAPFDINPFLASGPPLSNTLQEDTQDDSCQSSRNASRNASVSDLASVGETYNKAAPLPKIGARFSRESVRILKNWLSTHNRHPYPSDEEKEMLQRQTGLNKTQITNWLANARRRGKVQPPRSTSPHYTSSWSGPMDIPQRRGTPALEAMNPLQRWEHSPPENEPASVSAIARAVTASSSGMSSGLDSPFSLSYADDGSSKSLCNQSSVSSLGTSHSSNGSHGSAFSHGSRNSWGSFGSAPFNSHGRRRRRRRASAKVGKEKTSLAVPLKTFQCTFCTETFRTKHDWQRHEKSLHLSLERWVCSPQGPKAVNPETGILSCAFCGEANPDDAHIEGHNHSACQERTPAERTFYRKDHLNQHLRLVHNIKFQDWSMNSWKVATPEIRSRCGFCGIVMDTWTIRVDHLAEHFKTGYSMADWKGDWGFDNPVLEMVENSMPPYLIHHERTSPLPYVATHSPPESPRNAYELIKLEMAFFTRNYKDQHGRLPSDEEMMVEGCRIIYASELLSLQGIATRPSWLRDIIMSSDTLQQKARFGPLRGAAENRLASLKINGKDNLFEECPMEVQLQEFVKAKRLLGLTAMDDELQEEACHIVGRVEEVSTHPSEAIANWLIRLATSSTNWLAPFRRRAHLPRSEDVVDHICRSTDPSSIDSTIHSYSRLERELRDYLMLQRSTGVEPTDEDLQRQARIIIYEFDDGWNQTAADNGSWLEDFKNRHPAASKNSPAFSLQASTDSTVCGTATTDAATLLSGCPMSLGGDDMLDISSGNYLGPYFLNDANCYRRLAKELKRWVAGTMSVNNPNRHVPSDLELQHQARWILYDDDDPWNQTAADNAEWLQRFKRDAGILKTEGPGLPITDGWALESGGSGFAPPYACPKASLGPFPADAQVPMGQGAKSLPAVIANSYIEKLTSEAARPAEVFCSRELERGLISYVEDHVACKASMPSDAMLQTRARRILDSHITPADDIDLLNKFKDMVAKRVPHTAPAQDALANAPAIPSNMDLNLSDEDVNNILQDMNFEFDAQDFEGVTMEGLQDAGGVSLDMTEFKN
ncbi:Ff.00g026440.m01.CDS01 [Fusarium sp. VM40]|nr:Ff.00g026440.m01.CDS01 [Fusarium sp. VM40]